MLDEMFLRKEVEPYIDNLYLQFSLLKRHRDTAAVHVLRVFDELNSSAEMTPFGTVNRRLKQNARFRWSHEALPWALRWVWSDCPATGFASLDFQQELFAEAQQLMDLSSKYYELCRCFVLYSQGLFTVETIREQKRVKFSYRSSLEERRDASAFVYSSLQDRPPLPPRVQGLIYETSPIIHAIFPHYITKTGEMSVQFEVPHDMMEYFKRWASVLVGEMRFDMPGTSNLGEFTLDDFKAFWKGVFALCVAQIYAHAVADEAVGTKRGAIGSLIMQETEESLSRAKALFPVSDKSWHSIVETLVYAPSKKYWDPFWQPIIRISDGTMLISPHLIAVSSPQRNLLTLVSQSKGGRAVYDRISIQKEEDQLQGLTKIFRTYHTRTKVPVRRVDGTMLTDIDLLVFDRESGELLFVHAKSFRRPDTVQEVMAKDKEIQAALSIAVRAEVRVVELGTSWASSVLGIRIIRDPKIFSIVVSRDFIPSGWVCDARVPAADSEFVTRFIASTQFKGLASLYNACKCFYEDFEMKHPVKRAESEIQFGEYVFNIPSIELT